MGRARRVPTSATTPTTTPATRCATTRHARDAAAQSVPWGGETPWGGSKHPMPPLTRRMMIRAMRLLFAPPDPTRRVRHGERVQLAGREWP